MQQGLRIVKFLKDGNVLTILPSNVDDWYDEPAEFHEDEENIYHYKVICKGAIHAKLSCREVAEEKAIDARFLLSCMYSKNYIKDAIESLMHYCESNSIKLNLLVSFEDEELKTILESFTGWVRYYNRYEKFGYFVVDKI